MFPENQILHFALNRSLDFRCLLLHSSSSHQPKSSGDTPFFSRLSTSALNNFATVATLSSDTLQTRRRILHRYHRKTTRASAQRRSFYLRYHAQALRYMILLSEWPRLWTSTLNRAWPLTLNQPSARPDTATHSASLTLLKFRYYTGQWKPALEKQITSQRR